MNEIDRMSTQEQRQPDYALMKQSKYSINMAVSEISLGFAEYLQARLGRLNAVLNDAHSSILQSTVAMMPLLRNANFLSLNAELDRLESAQELDEQARQRAKEELREDYISSVNADMRRVRGFWLGMTTAINQVDDIEVLPTDEAGSTNSVNLENGIRLALQDLDTRLLELDEQRKDIDECIRVIDDKNLFDYLLPWIASDEELDGLDLSAPQVEMVKRGVRLFRKLVEHASQYIRYVDMVKLRNDLRIKRQHYLDQKDQLTRLLTDSIKQAQALSRVTRLDAVRLDYVREAQLLARQIGGFVTAFDLPPHTPLESLSAITAQGVALHKTLEPIASAWRI
ncbi:alpha-xenorhabdolysin family binary toxin subunit B [Pseudomonas kielensis]|jgi:hypothetical protein|uniref:alpha-xenorhabdolysin family binary toxin subunit B n=1 Tax=Pseudomonas TaxID=286 RepID=UPI00141279B6|nr:MULTISPECIES: alpha-xenorhabdolysin family binary toxin subunit B [Pseudomonas]NBB33725.1 alpha-xenorhabdolysin family binary toxin subunit B [Pseudomonas sp. BC115LW]WKL51690.1 alpha-xenorhabdolysin family binary toxin subunit B [Pseudomonas kielensis]